ncbi:hypothetical protein OESDEN_21682 [Oesophagostomum dentatum]|uniref:Uncharacterized protein n=1 Tax=Oesophagostomum dentatum TaxID=61180 RepID=A0A0B1S681_OESDE|nr:hypothetical protein OESDEN_21682 [Oesophagostomum dentatum]
MKDEEINKFASTDHWLEYFLSHCTSDLKRMSLKMYIYSPKDGHPCKGRDRSAGAGVGPQQYRLFSSRAARNMCTEGLTTKNGTIHFVEGLEKVETLL